MDIHTKQTSAQDRHRALRDEEITQLIAQDNRSSDWNRILVARDFCASDIHRATFSGDVMIGRGVAIHDAHIAATDDDPRINVINENGGRAILPSPNLTCASAFIYSKFRGDSALMSKFSKIVFDDGNVLRDDDNLSDDNNSRVNSNTQDNKNSQRAKTIIGGNSYIGAGVQIKNSVIGQNNVIDTAAQLENVMTCENVSIKNCARIFHTFVGGHSHIACCEIPNCFIAPFHGQHHNNSFLIASMIGGQSNIAAGATIGSNHNSRMYDGEIWAKRGFWPGLCVSLKHNSRFASFTMIANGNYSELDVTLPFSLVTSDKKNGRATIFPAFLLTRNLYALMRNEQKFSKRANSQNVFDVTTDNAVNNTPNSISNNAYNIECEFLAPDTVEEMFDAIRLLETDNAQTNDHANTNAVFVRARSAADAYKMMIRHYCAKNILPFMRENNLSDMNDLIRAVNDDFDLSDKWHNCGGMVISETALSKIIAEIKSESVRSTDDVNALFDSWASSYRMTKIRHAVKSFARLNNIRVDQLSNDILSSFMQSVPADCKKIIDLTKSSRVKDFTAPSRAMIYDTPEEMNAVLGKFEDDLVIKQTEDAMNALARLKI